MRPQQRTTYGTWKVLDKEMKSTPLRWNQKTKTDEGYEGHLYANEGILGRVGWDFQEIHEVVVTDLVGMTLFSAIVAEVDPTSGVPFSEENLQRTPWRLWGPMLVPLVISMKTLK